MGDGGVGREEGHRFGVRGSPLLQRLWLMWGYAEDLAV